MATKKNTEVISLRESSENEKSDSASNAQRSSTEKLLESCHNMLEENLMLSRKIKRHITMMAVVSYIKLFLILLPLILGFIFLPPLLRQVSQQYQVLLGIGGVSEQGMPNNASTNALSEFLKSLK